MENLIYGLCVTKMDIPATEYIVHHMDDVSDFSKIYQTIEKFIKDFKSTNPEGTMLRIIPTGTKAMLMCLVFSALMHDVPIEYYHYVDNDCGGTYQQYTMDYRNPNKH